MKKCTGLFVLLLAACSGRDVSRPEIDRSRFVQVYSEILMMKQRQSDIEVQSDSTEIILRQYQFTQDEFRTAFDSMKDDPEKWEVFFRDVQEYTQSSQSGSPTGR